MSALRGCGQMPGGLEAAAAYPCVGAGAPGLHREDGAQGVVAMQSRYHCMRCGLRGGARRRLAMQCARCPVPRCRVGGFADASPVAATTAVVAREAAWRRVALHRGPATLAEAPAPAGQLRV